MAVANYPTPTPEVAEQVHKHLLADQHNLGMYYRGIVENPGADNVEVAKIVGSEPKHVRWTRNQTSALLKGGRVNNGRAVLGAVARVLEHQDVSPEVHAYFDAIKTASPFDAEAEDGEDTFDVELAAKNTAQAEALNTPGIYVYTLPMCLELAELKGTDVIRLKVGHSSNSAIARFNGQTRTTSLPEEPVLLRVYQCTSEDSSAVEGRFHKLLRAAGHGIPVTRSAGTEWFDTTVALLDEVADLLSLPTQVVNP